MDGQTSASMKMKSSLVCFATVFVVLCHLRTGQVAIASSGSVAPLAGLEFQKRGLNVGMPPPPRFEGLRCSIARPCIRIRVVPLGSGRSLALRLKGGAADEDDERMEDEREINKGRKSSEVLLTALGPSDGQVCAPGRAVHADTVYPHSGALDARLR